MSAVMDSPEHPMHVLLHRSNKRWRFVSLSGVVHGRGTNFAEKCLHLLTEDGKLTSAAG